MPHAAFESLAWILVEKFKHLVNWENHFTSKRFFHVQVPG